MMSKHWKTLIPWGIAAVIYIFTLGQAEAKYARTSDINAKLDRIEQEVKATREDIGWLRGRLDIPNPPRTP